jgi:aspartate/methionine/tyrosine aminotransferase
MNQLPAFKLERYFAQYEFTTQYILSASDCESLSMSELLGMADADSLARWQSLSLGYTESPGLPALREEVARLYAPAGASRDDVLILAPEEGIFIAMQALLEPGDGVVVMSPAYQSLHEVARARRCDVVLWRVRPREDGWGLDLDELARLITPRTKMLVFNFPHNPTGYLPSRAEFDAILDVARRHGLYVFSDEMYRLLEYDPAARLPAACDVYEKAITLSGLSKSFALPGLRIGWLATRDRAAMARFATWKDYTTICNSAPGEVLGLIGLRAKETIVARNLDIIHTNLSLAGQFFADHAALFAWREPRAGSVAFVEWRGPGTVEAFCRLLVEQRGVLLVPGSLFDVKGGYFRLGLGRRNFADALARVRTLINPSETGA